MAQESSNASVRIFSARACAAPLEKAAELFEKQTGIGVQIRSMRHLAGRLFSTWNRKE